MATKRSHHVFPRLLFAGVCLLLTAFECNLIDDACCDVPYTGVPLPVGPGEVRVRTESSGVDIDPDGYTAAMGVVGHRASDTITARFRDVSAGSHVVQLHGIAPNCRAIDQNPRQVSVDDLDLVWVTFHVDCTTARGSVVIEATTAGDAPDPDGYRVTVAGDTESIDTDGLAQFTGVSAGEQTVFLHGLDAPCRIVGRATRTAAVTHLGTWHESYEIDCTTATADVSGIWDLAIANTRVVGALCDLDTGVSTVEILQSGTDLTLYGLGGPDDPWAGSVAGRVVTFSGTRPEDTGFDDDGGAVGGVTHASFTMLVDAGGASMSGTEEWTWVVAGEEVCTDGLSSVAASQIGG